LADGVHQQQHRRATTTTMLSEAPAPQAPKPVELPQRMNEFGYLFNRHGAHRILSRLSQELGLHTADKKAVMVFRLAKYLNRLLEEGHAAEYDAAVRQCQAALPPQCPRLVPFAENRARLEHQRRTTAANRPFLLASQRKAFDVDLGGLLAPFRIARPVSDPIYFPLAARELTDVVLDVDLPPDADSHDHQVVGLFLEIDGDLPDFPDPAQVSYRLSRGTGEVFMGNIFPSTATCFQRGPAAALFYGRPDRFFADLADYPNDSMTLARVDPSKPLYFRAYQLRMDYDLDCAARLRSAEQIRRDFAPLLEARRREGFSSIQPVSLICPVTKERIRWPIRWLHSRTLQCYDRAAMDSIPLPDARTDRSYFVDGVTLGILKVIDRAVEEVFVDMETMRWSLFDARREAKRPAEDDLDKDDLREE
jgi:hypothetical protein